MTDFSAMLSKIEIRQVDITTLAVDAIVNAANERMLGGGGVDGAIHRAAGHQLVEACREVPEVRPRVRCPTGEARLTAAFKLPARYVIHTVGPIWHGGTRGEPELLAACYKSALMMASEHTIRSIAFPAISCGVYGYPLEKAAAVAMHEVAHFLSGSRNIDKVIFAAFDSTVKAALEGAFQAESSDL